MEEKNRNNITRRDFMKKVGKGATALGVASVMPRLVKPAKAAKRDFILIGRPDPQTGPVSGFGEPTPWVDNRVAAEVNKAGGIYVKEAGKNLPIKFKIMDTASNPTKAAEIASRLILKDKIDLMVVLNTPDVVNPVSAVCERFEMPCVCGNNPADVWLLGGPYKWSYLAFWTVESVIDIYIGMWDEIAHKTNKVVGVLFQNDPDGMKWSNIFNKLLPAKGYKIIDPGRFPYGLQDYTAIINRFKKEKVEILAGTIIPPDWITGWRQCHRQGFIPKIATIGKALLLPAEVYALGGNLPNGLTTECQFSPAFPFKSSLTGETPKDICEAWTKETGKQWTQPIGGIHSTLERAIDSLRRAKSLDKNKIRDAIASTDMDTMIGHVKYNEKHYCETPLVGGQWVKGKKRKWDFEIIYNKSRPEIPITSKLIFPLPK